MYNEPNAIDTVVGLVDRTVTRIELQLKDGSNLRAFMVNGVAMTHYASQNKVVSVSLITRRGRITCPTPADPKGWLVGFRWKPARKSRYRAASTYERPRSE